MSERRDLYQYDDIIHLDHPVSKKHPQMSMMNRAAQFAPFSALTGYESAIKEAKRLTDRRIELDENEKSMLDQKLQILIEHIQARPEIQITYFKADLRKAGGVYLEETGILRKVDQYRKELILENGLTIPIEDIYEIKMELRGSQQEG